MADEIKDGGPAFPVPDICKAGMSLRDWFAGMALQALLSTGRKVEFGKTPVVTPKAYTEAAYVLADAMLRARAKK